MVLMLHAHVRSCVDRVWSVFCREDDLTLIAAKSGLTVDTLGDKGDGPPGAKDREGEGVSGVAGKEGEGECESVVVDKPASEVASSGGGGVKGGGGEEGEKGGGGGGGGVSEGGGKGGGKGGKKKRKKKEQADW